MRKIGKLLVFTYGYSLNVVRPEGDDLVIFFHFVGPYLHPSHVTRWVYTLAGLVESVSAGLAERVGEGYARSGEGGGENVEVLDSGSVCLLLDGKGPFGISGNLFEDSVR